MSGISGVVVALLILAAAGLVAGYATKAACLESVRTADGQVALNWDNWRQYRKSCYSDIVALYGTERLDTGALPYKTSWTDDEGQVRYMEYPVVTGLLQYAVAVVNQAMLPADMPRTGLDPPEVVRYFRLMAVVLALAWLAAVGFTVPLAGRPRDVALMAVSPLVAVHAFTNFDTVAVALAAAGIWAWARQRPLLCGVLLGLGAAAKLYPLLLLGPLLVLCFRAGRMPDWARAAGTALAAWLAVNLPIAILFPLGWWEFFRLNGVRPADHDSVYYAASVLTGWAGFDGPLTAGQSPLVLNVVSLGLFAAVCAGIAAIGLTAPRRPRVASLAFLTIAGFLLTNKVWSPQYSLWLVPLAVLAIPRVLPLLAWMTLDALGWVTRMGYFLGLAVPGEGNSPEVFVTVVLLRDLVVALLCGWVVWSIYHPDTDPVRRAGRDDPAGGPLDGATDLRRWPRSRRGPTAPGPLPAVRRAG
jgi:uncharacterized membrane protein